MRDRLDSKIADSSACLAASQSRAVHPIDHARYLPEFFRDRTLSLPDEHTLFASLTEHYPAAQGDGMRVSEDQLMGVC